MDKLDIQTVEQTSIDQETAAMHRIAYAAAETLGKHYANHMWMIGWAPGNSLIIKHGAGDSRYGYTIDVPSFHSASSLDAEIVRGGGELLERMGLARGAWNGDEFGKQYEGSPAR